MLIQESNFWSLVSNILEFFQYNVDFLKIEFQNAEATFQTLIKYSAALCRPGP